MLVVMYIISIISGVLVAVYENQEKHLQRSFWFVIALLSGLAFCIPVVKEFYNNSSPNFWLALSVFALIAWQAAFLLHNVENIINYLVAFFLFNVVIYFCVYSSSFPEHLETCSMEHVSTKTFPIITSVDGIKLETNIYGDDFIVGLIENPYSDDSYYQYYYLNKFKKISIQTVNSNNVKIDYIDNSTSPYVKIVTTYNCEGFTSIWKTHKITSSYTTHILCIPENSIKRITDTN